MDIEEHGPGRVGRIGCVNPATSHTPEQKAVDGAEGKRSLFGFFARSRNIFKDPLDLGCREIRVNQQACFGGDEFAMSPLSQLVAILRGSSILPDNGPVDRFSCCAVPEDCGLPLVGDADCRNITAAQARFTQSLSAGLQGTLPDIFRLMLYPAGLGEELLEFLLGEPKDIKGFVKNDGSARGGALIDTENMSAHSEFFRL